MVCSTLSVNQMHGFLPEFGIKLPIGQTAIKHLPSVLAEHILPPRLVSILEHLHTPSSISAKRSGRATRKWRNSLRTTFRTVPTDDLRRRSDHRECTGRRDGRRQAIWLQPLLRRIDRAGAALVQHGRLGIRKRGDKNIRRLLVQCDRAYMQRPAHRLGPRHADSTALKHHDLRTGEQAGTHRLGAGDPQHDIRSGIGCHACLSTTSATHDTTRSISSRNSRLRVRLVVKYTHQDSR